MVPPIRESTFKAMVAPWLAAVHKKDLLAVMSYPASDRQRRLLNLLNQPHTIASLLPNANKYIFISVDFRVDSVTTSEQLESLLMTRIKKELVVSWQEESKDIVEFLKKIQKQSGKTIVFAAIGCEKLTHENNTNLLIWSTIQQRLGFLRQILFFEANLLDSDHVRFFGNVPAFQPRIATMTLYEKEDVIQFIHYKEDEWKFSVSDTMKESIYAHCGGMLLLVKEALWYLRDNPHAPLANVWNHMEMQFNLATLWNGFGEPEKRTLAAIANNLPVTDFSLSQSIHYLLVARVIQQKGNTFIISIPLLQQYILRTIPKIYTFTISDHSIVLNGTPIDANFSKSERQVLMKLITENNVVVTRTDLANFVWPDNHGDYSDWALDSIISRIRKKLGQLGVPPRILSVEKKRGISLKTSCL